MVIHLLLQGEKQVDIARAMNISRSLVCSINKECKQDMLILGYLRQYTLSDGQIADIMRVSEAKVQSVKKKYKQKILILEYIRQGTLSDWRIAELCGYQRPRYKR